jgi:hypothetical protein
MTACSNKEQKLDGGYILVAAKYSDSTLSKAELPNYKTIKLFKSGYWITVTTFSNPDIVIESAAGGTYVINDGKCIETVNFSSGDSTIIGKTFSFDYAVNNKKYFRKGKMKAFRKEYSLDEEYDKITSDEALKDASLEGIWERTYGETNGHHDDDPDFYQFQIYHYPCYAWAQYHVKGKDFIALGGGTYTFDSNKLIVHIEYISYWPIKMYTYQWDVTKFSADSLQMESSDKILREVWRKIK